MKMRFIKKFNSDFDFDQRLYLDEFHHQNSKTFAKFYWLDKSLCPIEGAGVEQHNLMILCMFTHTLENDFQHTSNVCF